MKVLVGRTSGPWISSDRTRTPCSSATRGERLQLCRGVHRARRVVRVGQQVCRPGALGGQPGEHLGETLEVESVVGPEGRFDDPASARLDDLVEGVVDRRADDHRTTRVGEEAEQVGHAGQDVGHAGGRPRIEAPRPLGLCERSDLDGILLRQRVAGVTPRHGGAHGVDDGRTRGTVHLRDPHRDDVGAVHAPLDGRAVTTQVRQRHPEDRWLRPSRLAHGATLREGTDAVACGPVAPSTGYEGATGDASGIRCRRRRPKPRKRDVRDRGGNR